MSEAASALTVESFLISEMARLSARPDLTKRTAVRLCVSAAIEQGHLPKGSLVPPEKRLAEILGVSLGTVQSALGQLQEYNVIVRRRGDGTRVASNEAFSPSVWHFRLHSIATGGPLRIVRVAVNIERVGGSGAWQSVFPQEDNFLRIRRRLVMNDRTRVGADMVLPLQSAPTLLDTPPEELQMLNIRPYLVAQHGLDISRAEHELGTTTLTDLEGAMFGMTTQAPVFDITARAISSADQPVYYQRILAPCDKCRVIF